MFKRHHQVFTALRVLLDVAMVAAAFAGAYAIRFGSPRTFPYPELPPPRETLTVGRVRRGFLGLAGQVRPLPKRLARRLELAVETGVEVMQIEPGKAAAAGGLLAADVIVAMGGKPVRNVDEVHRLLDASSIGRKLPLKVVRGNDLVELEVTPAEG